MTDRQNEEFHPSPDSLPVDSNGCIDNSIRADRMCIHGRCRLCNKKVDSYNADLYLIECTKIEHLDIDDFAREYADITNSDYNTIINIIFDYCMCIIHDNEISNIFRKISTFSKLLNELEF